MRIVLDTNILLVSVSPKSNYVLQILENAVNVEFVAKYFRWNLIENDPDDNKFVDCAIVSNAKYIVTQDKHFDILKSIEFPKVEVINIEIFKRVFE